MKTGDFLLSRMEWKYQNHSTVPESSLNAVRLYANRCFCWACRRIIFANGKSVTSWDDWENVRVNFESRCRYAGYLQRENKRHSSDAE